MQKPINTNNSGCIASQLLSLGMVPTEKIEGILDRLRGGEFSDDADAEEAVRIASRNGLPGLSEKCRDCQKQALAHLSSLVGRRIYVDESNEAQRQAILNTL